MRVSSLESVPDFGHGGVCVAKNGEFALNGKFVAGNELSGVLIDVRSGHCGSGEKMRGVKRA